MGWWYHVTHAMYEGNQGQSDVVQIVIYAVGINVHALLKMITYPGRTINWFGTGMSIGYKKTALHVTNIGVKNQETLATLSGLPQVNVLRHKSLNKRRVRGWKCPRHKPTNN